MPDIGKLTKRVAVKNPSRTSDGDLGYTEAFTAASPSPVWARIDPATPGKVERMVANTIDAAVSHIVTMRFHAGVTTRTRIEYAGRVFDVRGLRDPEERHEWLFLACEEIV